MINNNNQIKDKKGNGTRCIGLGIKLKKGAEISNKRIDGFEIPTVSIWYVEYMLCQYEKSHGNDVTMKFKLKPVSDKADIVMK